MTNDNKLLDYIVQSGLLQAKQIVEQAEKNAQSVISEARKKAEDDLAQIDKQTLLTAQNMKKAASSNASLISSNAVLKAKREEIDRTVKGVCEYILSLGDEEYFELLYSLAKRLGGGEGELFLNEKDLSRLPLDFEQRMKDAGIEASVNKAPENIVGGFILRSGAIEMNCAVDAVIEEMRSQLEDYINASLFGEG